MRRSSGEGTVYFSKPRGRWVAALDVTIGGRRRRRVVYGKNRREAVEKLKVLRREMGGGGADAPNRLTVGEYLERWLEDSVRPSVRPTSQCWNVMTHRPWMQTFIWI